MRAIILIGGFGTRLRPLTLTRPKALLPVLNRPFLSYQLDLLKEAGVTDVLLACGKHTRPFQKDFRALAPRGMKIHFAFEPSPLGTGGAIRFGYDVLKRKLGASQAPVLVFNGDVFFDLPIKKFVQFHMRNKSECTVALTKVKDPSRFGVVVINAAGRTQRFLEKPKGKAPSNLINAGAYLFNPAWIESIPPQQVVSIERESFQQSLQAGKRMFGFPMKGYWNDIGTHQSFLAAHKDILGSNNRWTARRFLRKRGLPKTRRLVVLGQRCSIEKTVSLQGFVSCGNGVKINPRATIIDSVLFDGCVIGEGAQIEGAILGLGCRIGAYAQVRAGTVLGDKTQIHDYTRC